MTHHDGLYERLMGCSRDAFNEGHYDAAFHALKAALHVAQRRMDVDGLRAVAVTAAEQLGWLDQFDADHEHSSLAAAARHQASVFGLLSQQAQALAEMAEGTYGR